MIQVQDVNGNNCIMRENGTCDLLELRLKLISELSDCLEDGEVLDIVSPVINELKNSLFSLFWP